MITRRMIPALRMVHWAHLQLRSAAQASQVCRTSDHSHVRSELECGGGSRRQASEKVENTSSQLAKSRISSLHFTALHFTSASVADTFPTSYSTAPSVSSLHPDNTVMFAPCPTVPGLKPLGCGQKLTLFCQAHDHRSFVAYRS